MVIKGRKMWKTTIATPLDEAGGASTPKSTQRAAPVKPEKTKPRHPGEITSAFDSVYDGDMSGFGETLAGDLRQELSRHSR